MLQFFCSVLLFTRNMSLSLFKEQSRSMTCPLFPCPVSSLTHSLTTLWRVFSRSRNWYHFCCSNRETQPWKSHNWVKKFLKLPKSGKNIFLLIKLTFVWQPDNFIWWANSMPMASISTDVHALNWKNCSQMIK